MTDFRAYRINKTDDGIAAAFEQMSVDDLTDGNVVIWVSHSTINYKDALAATGTAPILRKYPLNGGIDLAGVVEIAHEWGARVVVDNVQTIGTSPCYVPGSMVWFRL